MDRLVAIGEASEALGVSITTLRRWETACSAETHEPLDTSLSSIPYPMESSIPPTFAASAALRPFGKARD